MADPTIMFDWPTMFLPLAYLCRAQLTVAAGSWFMPRWQHFSDAANDGDPHSTCGTLRAGLTPHRKKPGLSTINTTIDCVSARARPAWPQGCCAHGAFWPPSEGTVTHLE
jgi:hypothetical protein